LAGWEVDHVTEQTGLLLQGVKQGEVTLKLLFNFFFCTEQEYLKAVLALIVLMSFTNLSKYLSFILFCLFIYLFI